MKKSISALQGILPFVEEAQIATADPDTTAAALKDAEGIPAHPEPGP